VNVKADDCVLCELEQTLRCRSGEIRRELQVLNPVTEPNYDRLFKVLVDVDQDLRVQGRDRPRHPQGSPQGQARTGPGLFVGDVWLMRVRVGGGGLRRGERRVTTCRHL
jgi:hypothetical protein